MSKVRKTPEPQTDAATSAARKAAPLFYRDVQPLNALVHAGWSLADGDFGFAADSPYVPVTTPEFIEAARFYPVLFAGEAATPIALLGLDRNGFVHEGRWRTDAYVPAYVRRYPFAVLHVDGGADHVLGVDAGSESVLRSSEGEGRPLFADGEPTEITRSAVAFSEELKRAADASKAFSEALIAQGLLIERQAEIRRPDGSKRSIHGFRIVDRDRLATLSDEVVVRWHRAGWLALITLHLQSLERLGDLARAPAPEADAATRA